MPITIYTPSNLQKLVKQDLVLHIIELYDYIDVFSGVSIVKLKEENEKLKEKLDFICLITEAGSEPWPWLEQIQYKD